MKNEFQKLLPQFFDLLNTLLSKFWGLWSLILQDYSFLPGFLAALLVIFLIKIENVKFRSFLIFCFLTSIAVQPLLVIQQYLTICIKAGLNVSDKGEWYLYYWLFYFILFFLLLFLFFQYMSCLVERIRSFFRIKTSRGRRFILDLNSVKEHLPKSNAEYNFLKQVNLQKGIFVGKNENKKPLYIATSEVVSKHWQVCGTTGAGKTVFFQMMMYQLIKQGISVVVIDPKADEHLPYILDEVAKEENLSVSVIHLLGIEPQWNPFLGKSARQIADLLIAGGKLEDKGGDGDFYAIYCRKMARKFGRFLEGKTANLRKSISEFISMEAEGNKEAAKFFEILDILAASPVTNIGKGLDIEKEIRAGTPIYFQGSMREEDAMLLQRMAVTSIMQICESRVPNHTERNVSIFLDEFKVLINKVNLDSLTGIRSRGANVFLAHQTQGDLKQITSELSEDAVVDNVLENTGFKVIYKVVDVDTATAFASRTGIELIDQEVVQFEENSFLYERTTGVRSLRQTESFRVEPSVFQNLPKNCAVLLGFDDSKFIFTSYVPIKDHDRIIKPTSFTEDAVSNTRDNDATSTSSIAEGLVDVD